MKSSKYVSLDGNDINLGSDMLLQIAVSNNDKNVTVRKSLFEQVKGEHLITVSNAMKSTRGDLLEYENKFWIVTGSLFGIIVCLIIIKDFLSIGSSSQLRNILAQKVAKQSFNENIWIIVAVKNKERKNRDKLGQIQDSK